MQTRKKTFQPIALDLDRGLVRPLREAQNEFLQVLLSRFTLRRRGKGMRLTVGFDFQTSAVWRRLGKKLIDESLDPEARKAHQEKFEALLLRNERASLTYDDPRFPLRYGNGGTLPVIRRGEKDYYCLFYRDTKPIGWNIANGGADSLSELLDPQANIERELREELIVVAPKAARRYVFAWDEGQSADHPDFAVARRIWSETFRRRNFPKLEEVTLPLKWLRGSDSLEIHFENAPKVELDNIILNVNAEDFSIEVDRVAKLEIPPDAVICDGEIIRGQLLNRVIGLFEVQRFNAALTAEHPEVFPDLIFHAGREWPGKKLHEVVPQYLRSLRKRKIWAPGVLREYFRAERTFGLCPVTRNLVKRYLLAESEVGSGLQPEQEMKSADVFVCFPSEDRRLAKKLFDYLQARGRRVFFSEETMHHSNFGNVIDDAIDGARSMVVVCTQLERLLKPYVRFEWTAFHNDIRSGRKPWDTPMVTLTNRANSHDGVPSLPRALRDHQMLGCDPVRPQRTFDQLLSMLPISGGTRRA
jgi:hypothetical protein